MYKDIDAIADKARWAIVARRALLGAAFTDDSITISHDHRYYGYSSTDTGIIDTYIINRVAATMELTQVANNHVVGHAEWTCHVGKKQF